MNQSIHFKTNQLKYIRNESKKDVKKGEKTKREDERRISYELSSVADPDLGMRDPESGAFLTPGSGIRNRFFPGSYFCVMIKGSGSGAGFVHLTN
jgi:hypothetical protein